MKKGVGRAAQSVQESIIQQTSALPKATGNPLTWNACHLFVDDGCFVHVVGTIKGGITIDFWKRQRSDVKLSVHWAKVCSLEQAPLEDSLVYNVYE